MGDPLKSFERQLTAKIERLRKQVLVALDNPAFSDDFNNEVYELMEGRDTGLIATVYRYSQGNIASDELDPGPAEKAALRLVKLEADLFQSAMRDFNSILPGVVQEADLRKVFWSPRSLPNFFKSLQNG